MKKIIIYVILVLWTTSAVGKTHIPKTIVDFKFSNDVFYGTDRYFTNGLQLKIYSDFKSKSPVNYILLPDSKSEKTYFAATIIHNIYTPTNLSTSDIQFIDEPYAAYLLVGNRKESYNSHRKLKKVSAFQLGLIGPFAGGELAQNSVHRLLPGNEPARGWENQVSNDLAIQYMASIEKGLISRKIFEMNGFAYGIVGNPYTEFSTGYRVRFGRFEDFFSGLGLGMTKNFQLYVYSKAELTYVVYNAVLKGGLFHDDNLFDIGHIHRLLGHAVFGFGIVYKRMKLEISQDIHTPQFKGADVHRWGNVRIIFGG